jgi:hypothetical protein
MALAATSCDLDSTSIRNLSSQPPPCRRIRKFRSCYGRVRIPECAVGCLFIHCGRSAPPVPAAQDNVDVVLYRYGRNAQARFLRLGTVISDDLTASRCGSGPARRRSSRCSPTDAGCETYPRRTGRTCLERAATRPGAARAPCSTCHRPLSGRCGGSSRFAVLTGWDRPYTTDTVGAAGAGIGVVRLTALPGRPVALGHEAGRPRGDQPPPIPVGGRLDQVVREPGHGQAHERPAAGLDEQRQRRPVGGAMWASVRITRSCNRQSE